MKNAFLKGITVAAIIVFFAIGLFTEAELATAWQNGIFILSAIWLCSFILVNQKKCTEWFFKNISSILISFCLVILALICFYQEEQPKKESEMIESTEDVIRWRFDDTEDVVDVEPLEIEPVTEPALESLGEFKLTAYCPCKKCSDNWGTQTATGAVATEGRTVAVDPKVIPYGTVLIINGHEYIAEDCGSAIEGNHIDVYFSNHQDAWDFGVQYAEVFIKGGGGNG